MIVWCCLWSYIFTFHVWSFSAEFIVAMITPWSFMITRTIYQVSWTQISYQDLNCDSLLVILTIHTAGCSTTYNGGKMVPNSAYTYCQGHVHCSVQHYLRSWKAKPNKIQCHCFNHTGFGDVAYYVYMWMTISSFAVYSV